MAGIGEEQIGEFTQDGSVDLKGNPVLRSKTGGWTACTFVIAYEIFERMAFYAIATNLVLYLTRKLHQGTVSSSNNVSNWVGTVWVMPVLGAYVADAYLGRYWTFIIACAIYLSGMCLLTISVSVPSLKPPPCLHLDVAECKPATPLQLGVFYTALYLLALGTGGTKPNISTIGADQFDDFEPKEKVQKLSFFNWWMFFIYFGTLFANTLIVYIQDNVGWALGYGLPTIGLAVSILIFLFGTPRYRHKLPTGSPLTKMARVIVACLRKWRVPIPSDPKELYELDLEEYAKKEKFRIESTSSLRFLNKAAVIVGPDTPWMLCSVTQVEETKQMLRMIPIMTATFIPSTMIAQVNTLFVKQGTTLDRQIGHFKIPPASFVGFSTLSVLVSIIIYDRFFIKAARRWTRNPRGITILQRIGFGIFLHIMTMVIASLTERRRLSLAKDHGVVENAVYEVFERMAYYGIATNLVLYLTRKLHQGTVTSANNVNNWLGTVWMMPILGAFIADAYLGRYWTFVIASTIYFLGMCLITLSVSIPALKPPPCREINMTDCKQASTLQLGVFYTSLYILALGTGGTKPNISTIGADQFDDFEPKEKAHKLSFFNWWMFCIFIGTLFANTFLVYIQDNVGWALGYGIPTIGLAVSILIFLAGTPFYRHKLATGSPLMRMARVIVACIRKWREPVPSDPKELYELDLEEYKKKGKFRIDPTPSLRFLNKAAIKVGSDTHHTPWMLCSVTQVEETKQMLRMTPILITMFVPSVMVSQVNTLFVKQGTTLDRHIGNFEIPPASLIAFSSISLLVSIVIYDRVFVKVAQRWTKNPRGITLLKRIGIGLFLHIIAMVIASLAERRRLGVAKDHGVMENGGKVPLSIFTLLPQFVSIGISEAVFEVGKLEFFYDQAPESMKSLGTSYSMLAIGIGHFISSVVLSSVSNITKRHNHKGWILNNLNASHLDYYFAFLATLAALNLTFFVFVARFYVYRAEISDSMEILARKSRLS